MGRHKLRRQGHGRRTGPRGGGTSASAAKLGIEAFSPASVAQGSGAVNPLLVLGFGFTAASVVWLDGAPVPTTFDSPTQLSITVPAGTVLVPGFHPVYVVDASYPATSTTKAWAVNFPVPTLGTLSPTFAFWGEDPGAVTTTGTLFFSPGTGARVNGAPRTWAYASGTSGSLTLPAGDLLTAGSLSVTMVNPEPGGGASAAVPFSVRYRAPAIDSIAPTTIPVDSGDTVLLITAPSGVFYSGASVGLIDGVPAATTWIDATRITIVVPAAVVASPGLKDIAVENPTTGGGGGTSAASTLLISGTGAGVVLDTVAPNVATQHDDPLTITCTGSGFTGASVVHVDGVPVPTFPDTATSLTATITSGQGGVLATSGIKAITIVDGANTSDAKAFTVAAWSILNIATISAAWKATDVLTSGSNVTQWTDRTGNGRHLSQATGTKQGLLIASDPNFDGKPSVDFDGVDDFYAGVAISNFITASAFTAVCVYRYDSLPGTGSVAAPYSASALVAASGGFFGTTAKTGPVMYGYTNDGTYDTVSNTSVAVATPQWYKFRRAGGSTFLSITDGAETSLVCGNIASLTALLQLGSANTSGFLNGQIPEAFLCNGPLTTAEEIRVRNYIANEYGIPA